jgi:uncharacterized membrane protein (UPF0182 family)
VKSTGETSYPTLQRVLAAFGDKVGFAPTLDKALDQLFGGRSGATAAQSANNGQMPSTPVTADAKADLKTALDEANHAILDGQAALRSGNFSGFGVQQTKLSDALKSAIDAEARLSMTPAQATAQGTAPQQGQ